MSAGGVAVTVPAARTITAVQVNAGRDGLDWGYFDVIVGVREHLTGRVELRTAVAALGKDVARNIGVRTQLTRDAGAALAALLLPARIVPDIGLLPA
jgi:hypothetical protein